MQFFSHEGLIKIHDNSNLQLHIIREFCEYYSFDCDETTEELECFKFLYKTSHQNIDISDLIPKKKTVAINEKKMSTIPPFAEEGFEEIEDGDGDDVRECNSTVELWLKWVFIKPYRLFCYNYQAFLT